MIIIFSFYLSPNCIHCKCKIKRRHNLGIPQQIHQILHEDLKPDTVQISQKVQA